MPLISIFTFAGVSGVPRTIGVLLPLLFFFLLAMSRICGRYFFVEILRDQGFSGDIKRTIIYGAGVAGQQLAVSLRHDRNFVLVGFVDDNRRLENQHLDGVSVTHTSQLSKLVKKASVDTIFLALPSISRTQRKQIVDRLMPLRVKVQTLPSMQELVDGEASISIMRPIKAEDLLGRDAVAPNQSLLDRTIAGKIVLVTGAGGSIGSELCRQIARLRPKLLVLVEMSEPALYQVERELRLLRQASGLGFEIDAQLLNVTDTAGVERLFDRFCPDTVFHAAAYKHVPLVEANAISGLRNNIIGTRNTAKAANRAGCKNFILVSTDKAVRPTNVMGASKRVCELILQAEDNAGSATRFAIVRFGNVLGSSGSVVPQFERQIAAGGPVTLTHRNITRFFMTIPEAAELVIQAGAMAQGGDLFLLDMGKPVKIYDLASTMVELSGHSLKTPERPDGDIEIVEIGLRPGEKLYEELLIDDCSEATDHVRILRAREYHLPSAELDPQIESLQRALSAGDTGAALELLQSLVPEYTRMEGQP
ncbi:polysaccharide biosynthesis protein [Allopontixanthobacter confluentis]|uniref:polysaccharide biosynthesis protein n=1 Tax=Allopontixanthobacter confluentis TaxID=1849021 RepID=UPI0038BD93C9